MKEGAVSDQVFSDFHLLDFVDEFLERMNVALAIDVGDVRSRRVVRYRQGVLYVFRIAPFRHEHEHLRFARRKIRLLAYGTAFQPEVSERQLPGLGIVGRVGGRRFHGGGGSAPSCSSTSSFFRKQGGDPVEGATSHARHNVTEREYRHCAAHVQGVQGVGSRRAGEQRPAAIDTPNAEYSTARLSPMANAEAMS